MSRTAIAPATLLRAQPLFATLDEPTLARLAAAVRRRPLCRGAHLFHRGEPLSAMYVVVHGEIRLLADAPQRGPRLTGVVGPGESFGEPIMFLGRPAVVDAVAAGDALVLELPKEAVLAEVERSPRFARHLITRLSERVAGLVHELQHQAPRGGRGRLLDYLGRHARAEAEGHVVQLPATKAAVASQLNLSPEHFSRLLHELAADGLVRVERRRIVVPDLQRLAGAAGGDGGTPAPL